MGDKIYIGGAPKGFTLDEITRKLSTTVTTEITLKEEFVQNPNGSDYEWYIVAQSLEQDNKGKRTIISESRISICDLMEAIDTTRNRRRE